jgi:hypothetical protein
MMTMPSVREDNATPIDAALQPRLSSTIGTARSRAYCARVDSAWVEKAALNTVLNSRPEASGTPLVRCSVGAAEGATRRCST